DTCVFIKGDKKDNNKPRYTENKYSKEVPISSAPKFVEKYNNNTKVEKEGSKKIVLETKKNAAKLVQSKTSNKKIQVKHIIKALKTTKPIEKDLDYTSLINLSIKSFEKGNVDESLSYCDKAESFPESTYVVYYLKSAILFESDRIEESLKNIRKALFLNSESALNNYYAAKIMLRKDDYKKAIIHLNKALSFIENNDESNSLDLLRISKEDLKKHIQIAFKILEVKHEQL
ncbi:MAG: tetratricopeptide repeat protein, partial [Candidatus Sericytochromatia bacterium]